MINLALAKKLLKLKQEKALNSSEFKQSSKLKELIDEGVVHLQVRGQKTKILLLSEYKLELYLQSIGVHDLEAYVQSGLDPKRSRASMAQASSDTKSFKTQVQAGVYLASYQLVDIYINDEKVKLYTPDMSTFFVHKNAKLHFDEKTVIVGVENFENLSSIAKQAYLFDDESEKVFVYRNKYALELLSKTFNEYIHYGDFDLAGIHIYLHEVLPRLANERSRFFIPENIEALLEKGNQEDYFLHLKKYPKLNSNKAYLQRLIELIHAKKRSLHQEFLIEAPKIRFK